MPFSSRERELALFLRRAAKRGFQLLFDLGDGPVDTGPRIMVYLNPEHCGGALIELIEIK